MLLLPMLSWLMAAPAPLPAWAETQWKTAGLERTFARTAYLKSDLLQADFNGDGKTDVALTVTRRQTGSRGLLILHQGQPAAHVIGTGSAKDPDILRADLEWADYWQLYAKPSTVETLFGKNGDVAGSRNVRLLRPTIEVGQDELGGGMIYWDGRKYIWIHQTC